MKCIFIIKIKTELFLTKIHFIKRLRIKKKKGSSTLNKLQQLLMCFF